MMGATCELAAYVARLDTRTISAAALEMGSKAVMDFVGCAVAGAATGAARNARSAMPGHGGESTVLGAERSACAHVAAFLNAHACHVLEYDDLHGPSIYHPGAPTIAAALAVAERVDVEPADLMAAIVAGYEVGIRVGEAAGKQHYGAFHTTGTVGTIGAAAAAARVLTLTPDAVADAIGHAVTHAAGLWAYREDSADSKPFHAAHAAMMGVICADLAAAGARGARTGIENPSGFLSSLRGNPHSEALLAGLGSQGERITALTFKAYPCCGHTHPGIEAAKAVRKVMIEAGQQIDAVDQIEIRTYESALAVAGLQHPTGAAESAFSYPHIVAWTLSKGDLHGAFEASAFQDESIVRLRERVVLRRSDAFDAAYPIVQPVKIHVRLNDGSTFEQFCDAALGSPRLPMSEQAHYSKLRSLLGENFARWQAFTARWSPTRSGPQAEHT